MAVAAVQHEVIAHWQLLDLGMTRRAIQYRIERRRLHALFKGVYAVGRPQVSERGYWMAAVLACGPVAALSHGGAAALFTFGAAGPVIEVSVPEDVRRRGIRVHHRKAWARLELTTEDGIPVTTPIQTLIDLAIDLSDAELERAVNAADRLELERFDDLAGRLAAMPPGRGIARLRRLLARHTLTLTDSELERMFLPIARSAGLPQPCTQVWLDGYRVDFYWPHLGLVVETDGLRYHRTPATQARDLARDQAHVAAGRTCLRFTHAQVAYDASSVERILARVAATCRRSTRR
jgi:very-short-patch-repair endonuclease